jgi:AraC-like DNA-binding protein
MSRDRTFVEVLGRYSNLAWQSQKLSDLVEQTVGAQGGIRVISKTKPNPKPQKQVQRRLLDAEVDELAGAYLAGATLSELSDRFHKHRTTISTELQRRGVARRCRTIKGERLHLAIQGYQEGKSLASIGKDLGIAANTVRKALIDAGVELRPRRGWES